MSTEDKTQTTLLDEMRLSRETSNVAFVNFTDNHRKFSSHIFCFYEGEDGKYYNQKIKTILGDNIIPIKTGNKRETIKIWKKIRAIHDYDKVMKMFFVDRDMDSIPEDMDGDLYITPCYSIENLYVNINSFGSILEAEFSLSKIEDDYVKCINLFKDLYEQFNNAMIEFNALVYIRNKKNLGNGKIRLNNIKTHQMIKVDIEGVDKGDKYDEYINNLKSQLCVNDQELLEAIEIIKEMGDFPNLFRGKNQLDFMIYLLNLLKQLHEQGTFFDNKQTSVNINLTNNRLSELSQYAEFPPSLKTFILNHKVA